MSFWKEHSRRLTDSCAGLGCRLPAGTGLERWVLGCLTASGLADAVVRLSAHWKEGGGFFAAIVKEVPDRPPEWARGIPLRTAVERRGSARSQNAQVKANQYLAGVLAFLDAGGGPSFQELLFLSEAGSVAEGTISNLFIVEGAKRLLTPSAASGILKGVTRSFVMELARRRGLLTHETFLTRHDVTNAAECFITNTTFEILPVARVDGRLIGTGGPGPVTTALASDFRKRIKDSL